MGGASPSPASTSEEEELCPSTMNRLRRATATAAQAQWRLYHTSSSATAARRLRFAPSPTGHLHLGGLRTALYNFLLARQDPNGTFVLRIEDTDRTRFVEDAVEGLLSVLSWAKLHYDEGPRRGGLNEPYVQSERRAIYDRYLGQLLDSGRAYHCFCTPDELAATRSRLRAEGSNQTYDRRCLHLSSAQVHEMLARGDRATVRFKSSDEGLVQDDLVYDPIRFASVPFEDFILRKTDGLPTYHFANVVDDHEMGITHVIRGEEWLPSTPKHLALYKALGLQHPKFAHVPLLVNKDGSKLSKRTGDVRVTEYIDKGYEPEALLNYVALLGWHPVAETQHEKGESEIMPLADLISKFSVDGINKNRATIDPAKLDVFNRAHIQLKLASFDRSAKGELCERLQRVILAAFPDAPDTSFDYLGRVLVALKERIFTINDVPTLGAYFFREPELMSAAAKSMRSKINADTYSNVLLAVSAALEQVDEERFRDGAHIASVLEAARTSLEASSKDVMSSLRHSLTGSKVGATVPMTIATLGKARVLARLRRSLEQSA